MTQNFRNLTLLCAAAAILAGCQTFSLAEAGKPVDLANAYTVTPTQNWNLASDGNIQTWTLDGPVLQQVQFFSAIKTGDPLFEALSADQDKKPPVFDKGMTAIEIRDLYIATRARVHNVNVETTGLRPEKFADGDGFRFEYSFTDANGIEKQGFVKATTRTDQLYLVDYSAVKLFYYDRDLPLVEQLVNSIRAASA